MAKIAEGRADLAAGRMVDYDEGELHVTGAHPFEVGLLAEAKASVALDGKTQSIIGSELP